MDKPRLPLRTPLVYDFDGTLAPGSIQEHSLIPNFLKTSTALFWEGVKKQAREDDADEILVYMRHLLERARTLGTPLTKAVLIAHAMATPFFEGVTSWFDRINEHALARGLALEHFVISSGNEEMIAATPIAKHFESIFASRYAYGANGEAVWPAVAVNYTTKTQFLFRINKGIKNTFDNGAVNRWLPMSERPLPFSRMIYFGDGDTDIPSMKMTRHQGGYAVAVFDQKKVETEKSQRHIYNLIAEDRAHFVVPADYREGSLLDMTVKGVLGRIARDQARYRES